MADTQQTADRAPATSGRATADGTPRRRSTLRRLAWLFARPVRRARRERELVIQPYRGFGSPEQVFVIGRVLTQPRPLTFKDRLTRDLFDVARRLFRHGVTGVDVELRIAGRTSSARTDGDGYFRCALDLDAGLLEHGGWHHADLALVARPDIKVMARIFVHGPRSRCLIVSDIDDTVVETGVANRLVMLWRLFAQSPHQRRPVPGFADLFRALNRGLGGDERNPVVFVSRAPWTIYETLDAYFRLHRMPGDAVLLLREWGVRWHHPFARRDPHHKIRLIRHVLDTAPRLPVVLVGDSGQQDAEIYAEIVREYPGRIRCVLIRDLARSTSRETVIRALERNLADAGARLILTASTGRMAEVAHELGLIPSHAVTRVAAADLR